MESLVYRIPGPLLLFFSVALPVNFHQMTNSLLLQLLADNQIDELFEQLKTYNNRDLILLQSQWHDLRHREQLGTVSAEQADVEDARLRQSLLDLIEQVSAPSVQPADSETNTFAPPKNNRRLVIIVATALLLTILMITFWIFQQENESSQATVKTLAIPTRPISIVSTQAGPITWQLLKIERSAFNTENWQLTILAKCIKPLYGQSVHAGTMHQEYDHPQTATVELNLGK